MQLSQTVLFAMTAALTTAVGCSSQTQGDAAETSTAGYTTAVPTGSGHPIVGLAGKCLDVSGGSSVDGARVQLWRCNGTNAQRWTLLDGQIVSGTGKCLDVSGGSSADGTLVQLYECNGFHAAQQWSRVGDTLRTQAGKCLDVSGSNPDDGTQVLVWSCNGGDNQKWSGPGATPPAAGGSGPRSAWVPDGYVQVFGDEFDGASLDTSKWWTRYVYSDGTLDRLNDEQQRYRENGNHVMTGSTLKLTAKKVGGDYESGMIRSKTIVKYGYFEARVKMPGAVGMWPAFWLNGESGGWPPEIDIFEFVNNGVEDRATMLHTGVVGHGAQGSAFLSADPNFNKQWTFWNAPYAFPDAFHTIACLWDETSATTYVDGAPIVSRGYRWVHDDGSDGGYAHVLLNLAVGGEWAGRHGIDDSAFPQGLEIDYVRVYQAPGKLDRTTSTIGHDLCPSGGGC
ncbi:MAG: Beta-glucanase precursor [Labilithrix sp.]|nr:Beta-glucanase precursor [Labilithrix sp.]